MGDVFIHELAVVDEGAEIGEGTRIWHFAHIRSTARIGRNCMMGKGVYVDADVTIGDNVKIQNGVSVYQGVTIEDDVFLGPHMVFTNDLYPRAVTDIWEVSNTLVKRGASVGANAVVICNSVLGEYCMIGSGSVVTKDVPDHGLVVGNPARLVGFVCKCGRPAQKEIGRTDEFVTLWCDQCESDVLIPLEDYKKKVR
ncbi:MAG: acyltransferase [Candidatus Thorarchaeota archaeon]|jgi:acetyltransferase-like isoleucine patch superfamily enzyme